MNMDQYTPFECSICHNFYNVEDNQFRIRTLGCGHSMCTSCLQHMYISLFMSVTCPICKFEHKSHSINAIPFNFSMESVITHYKQTYMSLEPENLSTKIGEVCRKHRTKELFYCDSCKTSICVHCTVLDHPKGDKHIIIDLEEALNNKKSRDISDIEKEIKKLQEVQNKFASRLQIADGQKEDLHKILHDFGNMIQQIEDTVLEVNTFGSWQTKLLKEAQLKINGLSFYKQRVIDIMSFKDLTAAEVVHEDALRETDDWLEMNDKSTLFSEMLQRSGKTITMGNSALNAFNAKNDLPV